ncbi:CLUMA_CG012387, isoform A [Clunio marinus]|uniref:CLUMA_CG012387, isoform A n=1 Tax=Clunio marinus TaxID=568069 RepID=A0A1J1IEA8_9DIPT|nr:CLUMA_CG012387, isoform A [Clunio marinus]
MIIILRLNSFDINISKGKTKKGLNIKLRLNPLKFWYACLNYSLEMFIKISYMPNMKPHTSFEKDIVKHFDIIACIVNSQVILSTCCFSDMNNHRLYIDEQMFKHFYTWSWKMKR